MTSLTAGPGFLSPLHEMTQTTPTCLWNDSAALAELEYSIAHGAVGATCNPVIVLDILKQEMHLWKERILQLICGMPTATEDQIAWALVEEISATRAALLRPAFDAHHGRNGRLSIQTDPRFYRNPRAMVDQAIRFSKLAPNMIVKAPVTRAGVAAIEEATAHGVSINATVCFSLPQCIAVAEAIERGLRAREKEGLDIATMGPVCTIMVGRVDDWLKVVMEKQNIITNPGYLEWAGVAIFKKTYRIFQQRGYRVRLLAAAYRNHMQWSELIGGDLVLSPPYKWQRRFNASDVTVADRIGTPVDPVIVQALLDKFPDFARAYQEDGLPLDHFDTFPPTARTLRQFIEACHELCAQVRELMIPNPIPR
jgi:transaldolase